MSLDVDDTSALELSAALIFVYMLQIIGFEPAFQAGVSEWWKFFTSFLGHSGPEHLFNNLFFIALFGTIYRSYSSERIFWSTFLISAIGANLTAFIFYTNSPIIGASGGAMGILAALAVYKPRQIGLALGVPAPMYMVLVAYIIINFAGITGASSVAYEAHLFGLFTGAIFGFWLRDNDRDTRSEEEYSEDSDWREKIRKWERKYMIDS